MNTQRNAKKKDPLLDVVVQQVAARIEKVNGRQLSDAAKADLATLSPETLGEILLGASRNQPPAPPDLAAAIRNRRKS